VVDKEAFLELIAASLRMCCDMFERPAEEKLN
jgi:hypothetical protein